jgi:hypothetical protein
VTALPNPRWAIVGYSCQTGGVDVIGSRRLTGAQLDVIGRRFRPSLRAGIIPFALGVRYRLGADLEDLRVVHAANYGDALRELLSEWSPDDPVAAELAP